jgi:hypothetical protein
MWPGSIPFDPCSLVLAQYLMADIRICCPNIRILGHFPDIADIS